MRVLLGGMAAVLLLCAAACSEESAYPSRPVRLIVPFPAGGSSDLIARTVSERAARALGHQIVIDNRPGAGGNIGTEAAARAPADGYTLWDGWIAPLAFSTLFRDMGYTWESWAPIGGLNYNPFALVVRADQNG